jgi:hypothetical protein
MLVFVITPSPTPPREWEVVGSATRCHNVDLHRPTPET